MPNTTELASIDSTLLADVSGGCGRRRHRCGGRNTTIINNNIQQAEPVAAPAAPAGPAVDVNVGYQQAQG